MINRLKQFRRVDLVTRSGLRPRERPYVEQDLIRVPCPAALPEDIRENSHEIVEHLQRLGFDEFRRDRCTFKAVAYSLLAIGEAMKHMPCELRDLYPAVEWNKIAGMRDVLAHGYFALDERIVWNAAMASVPDLLREVEKILSANP